MITRRSLVLTSLLIATHAPLARAEPVASDDPVAIVTARLHARRQGQGRWRRRFCDREQGGEGEICLEIAGRVVGQGRTRTHQRATSGPVDFNPVTNSQEPDVKILQGVHRGTPSARASDCRHYRRPQHPAAEARGSGHPLRLRARDGWMEDRRHQRLKRRRGMVNPNHALSTFSKQ